jgi:transposase
MIPISSGVQVWLATGHTDMRKGFDGLALLVQETLKRNPHNGHMFVFRGRRGGLIKVLWHDGQGMCLFAKRLERGRFVWPSTAPREAAERTVTITPAQLGYLLEGIDWRLPQHTWRPTAAGILAPGPELRIPVVRSPPLFAGVFAVTRRLSSKADYASLIRPTRYLFSVLPGELAFALASRLAARPAALVVRTGAGSC